MPDDERQERAASAVWADLLASPGDAGTEERDLDPNLADALRRLHAMTQTPPPAAVQARVDRAIRPRLAAQQNGRAQLGEHTTQWNSIPGAGVDPKGRVAPSAFPPFAPLSDTRPERRRRFAQLAVAAMLLLLLGLGYLAAGRWSVDAPRRDTIPASVGDGVLLDVGLPAEIFPQGAGRETGLVTATVPPGPPVAWAGAVNDPGLRVDYVLAGTYVVWTEGPARFVRAGGSPQEVLAGSEVELGPGDAWIARMETAFTYTNPGAEPARLLVWTLTESHGSSVTLPGGWDFHHDIGWHRVSVPAGPVRLLLRQVDVAAGDAVLAPAGGFQVGDALPTDAAGTAVTARLGVQSDGAIKNVGQVAVTLYVVSLEPGGFPDLSGEGQALADEA